MVCPRPFLKERRMAAYRNRFFPLPAAILLAILLLPGCENPAVDRKPETGTEAGAENGDDQSGADENSPDQNDSTGTGDETPEEPPGDEPGAGTPEEPPGGEPGAGGGQSEALEALSAWFADQPANTPETPYFYSLADASFEDLAAGADGLGALLAALHGRYAEIDLSGVSGGELAAGPTAATSVRLNAEYLVAVTLPASLAAIGRRAFVSCRNLKTVALKGTTPPTLTGNDVFRDCSPDLVFLVDDDRGTLAWPRASGWRNYGGRIRIRFEAGGIVFSMTCVPATSAFPLGFYDDQTGSVASPYLIAETVVTRELWIAVRDWALEHGYSIRPGSTVVDGEGQEPARNNWYNFAAWCNALTEWFNEKTGAALTPAYYADYTNGFSTIVRSGDPGFGQQETEMPYRALESKTGFRLPNRNEWELAARWRNDYTNTVAGYSNPWFTRGNSASGAAAPYTDATETLRYATGTLSAPLPVKSRLPNALGLYDMSGNVWELLNDGWYYAAYNVQNCNIQVIEMGGGWNMALKTAQLAYDYYYEADGTSDWDGLRLVLPLP
jgi:hypothetical protein